MPGPYEKTSTVGSTLAHLREHVRTDQPRAARRRPAITDVPMPASPLGASREVPDAYTGNLASHAPEAGRESLVRDKG